MQRHFGETFCRYSSLNFQEKWPQEISRKILNQRMPWGGVEKEGEENLTKDTPPKKKGFGPLVRYVFHPPGCRCSVFPVQKSTTEQTRSSFGRVQKLREGTRPPYHGPTQHFSQVTKQNSFTARFWEWRAEMIVTMMGCQQSNSI